MKTLQRIAEAALLPLAAVASDVFHRMASRGQKKAEEPKKP